MRTNLFTPIQLEEMDQVKLMNRIDQKFWFHEAFLQGILQSLTEDYFVLDIKGQVEFPYTSTYFDTPDNRMYTLHHNGKLKRYKIRRRSYLQTGLSFLEIKAKNNKGHTDKKRIPSKFNAGTFTPEEHAFIQSNTPYSGEDLTPSHSNKFVRLTLVNRNFRERCTIDRFLEFKTNSAWFQLQNLTIIEIKTEGRQTPSPLKIALNSERIRASGFSKYCMGRAFTESSLKRNRFKKKIRTIEKTIEANMDLYKLKINSYDGTSQHTRR